MKALQVVQMNGSPRMAMTDVPEPEHGPDELLVAVQATALNRADLLQKAGKYPPPEGASPLLGLEMSGIVIAAGESCRRFRVGDRVCGILAGGGYAERCAIPESIAMEIPDPIDFSEAAAIPEAFRTAWQALVWLGEIQKGETVLIHGGASGVGSAAIQIASRLFECRVLATAGSEEKREFCRELGAELAMGYRESDFRHAIETEIGKEATGLIVDIAGASHWNKNLDLLSMDGRMVLLSMLGGSVVEQLSLVPLLRKRLTIRGSTLRNRPDSYKAKLSREFEQLAMKQLQEGGIYPVIDSRFDWHDVEEAHERMKRNLNKGKIILTGMGERE